MIHVPRSAPPTHLAPADAARWSRQLCDRRAAYYRDLSDFRRGARATRPERPRANRDHYAHAEVRGALELLFGSKCSYCESEVRATGPQHVEHYRPAARYPVLAYAWDNLLLACHHCNTTHKSDRFPVAPSGNTPKENRRQPCARTGAGEAPLMLDPCADDPEPHLTYRGAYAVALSDRGRSTRRVCGLNRDDLVRIRRRWLTLVRRSLEEYRIADLEGDAARRARHADDLREFIHDDAPYAAMVRAELAREGIDWRSL